MDKVTFIKSVELISRQSGGKLLYLMAYCNVRMWRRTVNMEVRFRDIEPNCKGVKLMYGNLTVSVRYEQIKSLGFVAKPDLKNGVVA